jgi:DNA recombination protein RmuC
MLASAGPVFGARRRQARRRRRAKGLRAMPFDNPDLLGVLYIAGGALLAVLVLFVIVVLRQERSRAELGTRISQLNESAQAAQVMIAQRMIDQERALQEQLDRVSMRVSMSVDQAASQTRDTLTSLRERLAVVDEAQRNITALSTQMVGLQDILSNKQARGAFGEMQLRDLVEAVLPPDAYEFQCTIGEGVRPDCLIRLPNPPGPLAIDAKFPLESYQRLTGAESDAERIQAARDFSSDVLKHVRAIANKYIVPGQTGDAALMFLPSEAIYAELHARYANVIEQSFRERVFIVSPTTLWATLNTIRAIFRDVRIREQAGLLQKELHVLMEDMGRLDERVEKLALHFRQASKDIEDIQTSARKVSRRAEKITTMDLGEEEPAAALEAARGAPARGWVKGATPPGE